MRGVLATILVALLAGGPLLTAAPQDAPATAMEVVHTPVGCMVAGTNPQIEAGIAPAEQVQAGRVYFKSALGDAYYYVEMTPDAGRYVGVLPKPRIEAGPVTYYVEGLGRDYSQRQTPENRAVVVEQASDCGDKPVAALGPNDPVRVFSIGGGTAPPPGFSGVSSVTAGVGTGAGTAGAAAGGGRGISGMTAAIIAGAVAVGVGTILIVTRGEENPPASPSR